LSDPALRAGPEHIQRCLDSFCEYLSIRASSPFFRLRTAREIQYMVHFLRSQPRDSSPSFIAMEITGTADPSRTAVLVCINADRLHATFSHAQLQGRHYHLHPAHRAHKASSANAAIFDGRPGKVVVPGRTIAVFEEP
jgi:pullulanase